MPASIAPPIRTVTAADLCPAPASPARGPGRYWLADAAAVRLTADGPFPAGWYHVRLAVRSASRFTVRKRCDLVFDPADDNPRPPGREQFAWNRNFDEQFMLRLTRPSSRVRIDLQQAEGRLIVEQFDVRPVSTSEAFSRAVREKLRLIRAYQCVRPVLWKGGKLLLSGKFRQFRAKVLKGLVDSRQMRLGLGRGDEVDAAWWRRHALTKDEADRVAAACEAMIDPPPIAVVIPTDGSRLDQVRLAAHSVRRQIYPHWELLLAAAGPAGLQAHLNNIIGPDARMRHVRVSAQAGLATAVGKLLGQTECQRIVVLPPGVELAEHALYHLAAAALADPAAVVIGGPGVRSLEGRLARPQARPDRGRRGGRGRDGRRPIRRPRPAGRRPGSRPQPGRGTDRPPGRLGDHHPSPGLGPAPPPLLAVARGLDGHAPRDE